MTPQMISFPTFIRQSEQSPRGLNSAFPPFKVEHRYKGVYERAGFDVNVGSHSKSSPIHSHSNNSTDSNLNQEPRRFYDAQQSFKSNPYQMNNDSRTSHDQLNTLKKSNSNQASTMSKSNHSSGSSKKSSVNSNFTARYNDSKSNSSITSNPEYPMGYNSESNGSHFPNTASTSTVASNSDDSKSRNIKNLTLDLNENQPDFNSVSNDENYIHESNEQRFDPRKLKRNQQSQTKVPNFQPSIDQNIAQKPPYPINSSYSPQLQQNQAPSFTNDRQISSQMSSQQFMGMQTPYSPQDFPQSSPGYPPRSQNRPLGPAQSSQLKDDKLSSALNGFRSDIETHKNIIHTSNSPPTPATPPDLPNMSPSQLGLSKFEPLNNDPRFSYGQDFDNSTTNNPSQQQFQHFTSHQTSKDDKLDSDYKNFLDIQSSEKHNRTSQVSMVSSVLSKDSSYNEEDEKIEKELEKQLESLKMSGSNLEINTKSAMSSSSTDTNFINSNPPVPQFTIQDMDEQRNARSSSGSNNLDSNCDEMSIASIESIQPLSVSQSHKSPIRRSFPDEIREVGEKKEQEEDDDFKPLSPKTHSVEQELENINFQITQTNDSPSVFLKENQDGFNDVAPSGTGPCRNCGDEIDSNAKGSMKAIFSKTGELSGQWHRKCFHCSHDNCHVQFNKHVQVYALHDQPLCFEHYHILNDSICQHCNIGIEGSCIENDHRQKWHLKCLKCQQCQNQISDDYYLINDFIYCEKDAKFIINGGEYNDGEGNIKSGGLSVNDKIEKRRTKIYNVNL